MVGNEVVLYLLQLGNIGPGNADFQFCITLTAVCRNDGRLVMRGDINSQLSFTHRSGTGNDEAYRCHMIVMK